MYKGQRWLWQIWIALEAVLPKLHGCYAKLTPGWVLIRVNFDPIQEIGPKVESAWVLFHGTIVYGNLHSPYWI